MTISNHNTLFQQKYRGYFVGILRWPQLDQLWQQVKKSPEGWYLYFIGQTVPTLPVTPPTLLQFIDEVDKLLRHDHHYDYCGIVYTDHQENPTMIKIFDPNHLGASCGSSGKTVPPRWLLSRLAPEEIIDTAPIPATRQRWWQQFFT